MSYSQSLKATDKSNAKTVVATFIDTVIASQPAHAIDKDAILSNANNAIDLIADDPDKDIVMSITGYLSGDWSEGNITRVTGVNISFNVNTTARISTPATPAA